MRRFLYDWRGYTTVEGAHVGKNHGNEWRIKPYAKSLSGIVFKGSEQQCVSGMSRFYIVVTAPDIADSL